MPTAVDLLKRACEPSSLVELRRLVWWHLNAIQYDNFGNEFIDPEFPAEFIDIAVNEAYTNLAQIQILGFDGAFLEELDQPIAAGERELPLPAALFKVENVLVSTGAGWTPLEYFAGSQVFESAPDGVVEWLYPECMPTFFIKDARTLYFRPAPATTSQVRIRYYRLPTCLFEDKDRPDPVFLKVWTSLLTVDAAIIAKASKEDADTTNLEKIRDRWFATFVQAIEQRSTKPQTVVPFWPEDYGA